MHTVVRRWANRYAEYQVVVLFLQYAYLVLVYIWVGVAFLLARVLEYNYIAWRSDQRNHSLYQNTK